MSRAKHLLLALTPHGFGHAAMTGPVVEALRAECPDLHLTIQTAIGRDWLLTRYAEPFDQITDCADFGMRMNSALSVDVERSYADYRALHHGIEAIIAAEARRLRVLQVDAVFSNISYISLLAAQRAGIPSLALCCLNWHDLFGHYCHEREGAAEILALMRQGYESAEEFLCPAPSMPMDFANVRAIGPLAKLARRRREELAALVQAKPGDKIGLIAFGGMAVPLDFSRWPRIPGWKWVITADPGGHPDLIPRDSLEMGFSDILWSCDLVVGKPGYGTFAEAGVAGTPMLYLPRPDWPESPHLVSWLETKGRALCVQPEDLFSGAALESQLQKLFSLPTKPLPAASGIAEAVLAVKACLRLQA